MKRFLSVMFGLFCFGLSVPWADALIIESPVEGQTIVMGEPIQWVVRPEPGEVCTSINGGENPLNPATGKFEYTDIIQSNGPLSHSLGKQNFWVMGEGGDKDSLCLDAKVTLTVVLPPTTVVVSIDAAFTGGKKTFLEIARKLSGELVVTEGTHSTNELSVSAVYSDGVERGIASKPETTYKSLNEKVAVVIPRIGTRPLVRATGPGKTSIIVQYGEFTDRVTVHVKECPYIEGETDKHGCPLR